VAPATVSLVLVEGKKVNRDERLVLAIDLPATR
jgi:hypothetical protein